MKALRRISLCLAALLLAAAGGAASAEEPEADSPAAIRSAYCQQAGEGAAVSAELFAFVSRESDWPRPLLVTAGVRQQGKEEILRAESVQTVEESGQKAAYLLLVDHSNSMRPVSGAGNVSRFAAELARRCGSGNGVSYALATFGKEFQVELEFTTDAAAFQDAAGHIAYGEGASDPARALLAAADYLDAFPRAAGECVNLILITDGIPEKTAEDSLALENAAKRLNAAPSILVHTFGLKNQNREESALGLETLASMGRGVHAATPETTAVSAAGQIVEMVNGLYAFRFATGQRQSEQTLEVGLYFNGEEVDAMRVPVLTPAGTTPADGGETPEVPGTEPPAGENETGEASPPEGDAPSEQEGQAGPREEGGGENADPNVGPDGSGGTDGSDPQPDGGNDIPVFWIAAAGLLLLAGIGYFLLRGRSAPSRAAGDGGILMVLEVASGECVTKEREFYLSDELTIGRSRVCDVVWKDSGMAAKCARIFRAANAVCIEDIGASGGVYLGGMRLHSANRLRSGDEIAIGSARFRFKF